MGEESQRSEIRRSRMRSRGGHRAGGGDGGGAQAEEAEAAARDSAGADISFIGTNAWVRGSSGIRYVPANSVARADGRVPGRSRDAGVARGERGCCAPSSEVSAEAALECEFVRGF